MAGLKSFLYGVAPILGVTGHSNSIMIAPMIVSEGPATWPAATTACNIGSGKP